MKISTFSDVQLQFLFIWLTFRNLSDSVTEEKAAFRLLSPIHSDGVQLGMTA
jgi:hypothetical protein